MNRREFLKFLGGGVAAAAVGGGFSVGKGAGASGMNILFVDIEDMTARAVGCYGNGSIRNVCPELLEL